MKFSIAVNLKMSKTFCFLIALILTPTSAAADMRIQHAVQTATRVLIVGGEGLFPPSPNETWSKIMLASSEKFANALKENLAVRGALADVYINKQKDKNIRSFAAKILAHQLHHALLQVGIVSDDKGDLYLKPVYNPLELQSDSNNRASYKVLSGMEERYRILSAANPRAPMPGFSKLARQFVDSLRANRYIGIDGVPR